MSKSGEWGPGIFFRSSASKYPAAPPSKLFSIDHVRIPQWCHCFSNIAVMIAKRGVHRYAHRERSQHDWSCWTQNPQASPIEELFQ
jgi:hypothetical protein